MPGVGGVAVLLGRRRVVGRLSCWVVERGHSLGRGRGCGHAAVPAQAFPSSERVTALLSPDGTRLGCGLASRRRA